MVSGVGGNDASIHKNLDKFNDKMDITMEDSALVSKVPFSLSWQLHRPAVLPFSLRIFAQNSQLDNESEIDDASLLALGDQY